MVTPPSMSMPMTPYDAHQNFEILPGPSASPICMKRRVVVVPGGSRLIGGQRDTALNNRLTSGLQQPDKQVSRRAWHVQGI